MPFNAAFISWMPLWICDFSKGDFSISEGKYKGKMQMQRQMHSKMFFMS